MCIRDRNTIGCILDGVDAEALVVRLSRRGVFISAGSACHAGKTKGSHVLAAMGVPEPRRASFVRVSLGAGTTDEEADRAAAVIVEEAARRLTLPPDPRGRVDRRGLLGYH